jgi:hypothetical protein
METMVFRVQYDANAMKEKELLAEIRRVGEEQGEEYEPEVIDDAGAP